jgi:hypothetical protein
MWRAAFTNGPVLLNVRNVWINRCETGDCGNISNALRKWLAVLSSGSRRCSPRLPIPAAGDAGVTRDYPAQPTNGRKMGYAVDISGRIAIALVGIVDAQVERRMSSPID